MTSSIMLLSAKWISGSVTLKASVLTTNWVPSTCKSPVIVIPAKVTLSVEAIGCPIDMSPVWLLYVTPVPPVRPLRATSWT